MVNVLSPRSLQNGAEASVVLTLIALAGVSPIWDAARASAVTGVMPPTMYAEGTGTSGALYAGVEQPTNTALSADRDLRMGAALISCHQRWPPWMERFDVVGYLLERLAGHRHRSLGTPVHVSAHQHVEERCEEKSKEGYTEHPREHGDSHHAPHLRAGGTRK